MTGPDGVPQRLSRAVAVALLAAPAVIVAHLLTSGAPPSPQVSLLVCGAVLVVALLVPTGRRGALVLAMAIGQLAGHGVLAASAATPSGGGCLPIVGRGAQLGLRLAVLRADGCPPGSLAFSSEATAATSALLAAALVLASHVAITMVGALLLAAGDDAWASACTLARVVVRLVTARWLPARVPIGAPRHLLACIVRHPAAVAGANQWITGVTVRRGPPLAAVAT